ncbi:hypothetical protein JD844_006847, partial [Phrynosoma platyrhinos]
VVELFLSTDFSFFFLAHDTEFKLHVMDDTALSLGAIDVSYSTSSSECTVSRCKHSSEEWKGMASAPQLGIMSRKEQEIVVVVAAAEIPAPCLNSLPTPTGG